MDYKIREIKADEYDILKEFTYKAIFVPIGAKQPGREILEQDEMKMYYVDFSKARGDFAYIAEVDSKIIGCVWSRMIDDYGHVDDETPSLAISIYEKYRSQGIGTDLMKSILNKLKEGGYEKVSLSVHKENYAVKMYRKLGFVVVEDDGEDLVMVKSLILM